MPTKAKNDDNGVMPRPEQELLPHGEYPDQGTFGYGDKAMSEAQAEVMPTE